SGCVLRTLQYKTPAPGARHEWPNTLRCVQERPAEIQTENCDKSCCQGSGRNGIKKHPSGSGCQVITITVHIKKHPSGSGCQVITITVQTITVHAINLKELQSFNIN